MMLKGILIDLGNTLIEQRIDNTLPLSSMQLVAFPDAADALAKLKAEGYLIAIVSNTTQSNALQVAEALGDLNLRSFIDLIVTSVDAGVEKPHPGIFLKTLETLGLSIGEVVMIGDDIQKDIGAANALGITTIFLNRGMLPVDVGIKPTYEVHSLLEIPTLIRNQIARTTEDKCFAETNKDSLEKDAEYEQLQQAAQNAQKMLHLNDAARLYLLAANKCRAYHDYEKASNNYMQAAYCLEQDETWRQIGSIWLSAAHMLEKSSQLKEPAISDQVYEDYDASQHFFLGIDPESWKKVSVQERAGRAYRYAGYHLEEAGTNQSAYNQYFEAGLSFEKLQDWEQAGRAFYLAIITFIRQFGELNQHYLTHFEIVTQNSIKKEELKFLHRARLYYRRIAAELLQQGNEEDQEKMYIKHREISRIIAYKKKYVSSWFFLSLWKLTSNYGTNFWKWLFWSFVIVAGWFAPMYLKFNLLIPRPGNILEAVYFSMATFVTATYLDFTPVGWGRLIALLETAVGLLMLGSLLTFIINKMTR